MGKYSINHKGKVLDFKFKKNIGFWTFYIGDANKDIFIGHLFNMGRSWSGVACNPHKLNGLEGFKTRLDACMFLLKLEGYSKV